MPIALLSDLLISQIAAGEVVERPASVVKELVENALDAQAQYIEIRLHEGGMRRISVRDNGCGIPESELALAFLRHATSKIRTLNDLESVLTMGFRGEALASIASVACVRLSSRTEHQEYGMELDHQTGELKPISHPTGTTIVVEDLYHNTPARRKFLKTPATEFAHCYEVVKRIAMANPAVEMVLFHNDKRVTSYPAQTVNARCMAVLGEAFAVDSIPVQANSGSLQLNGLIGSPTIARNRSDQQYFYVNGRFVRDKVLNAAAKQAYHDVLHHQFYPAYVLNLQIEPELVDVNVHPAKTEVRFRQPGAIHQFIVQALQKALSGLSQGGNSLKKTFDGAAQRTVFATSELLCESLPNRSTLSLNSDSSTVYSNQSLRRPPELLRSQSAAQTNHSTYFNFLASTKPAAHSSVADQGKSYEQKVGEPSLKQFPAPNVDPQTLSHSGHELTNSRQSVLHSTSRINGTRSEVESFSPQSLEGSSLEKSNQNDLIKQEAATTIPNTHETVHSDSMIDSNTERQDYPLGYAIAQLHDIYILAQNREGLIVVDMHAAHERILYEQLKQQLDSHVVEIEEYLVPHVFQATPIELAIFEQFKDQMADYGIVLSQSGIETIMIRALPRLIKVNDPVELVKSILMELNELEASSTVENLRNQVLARLACHLAIKAHEKLTIGEMNHLLRMMEQTERANQCNHGRPTWITFSLSTIDQWFLRGQ